MSHSAYSSSLDRLGRVFPSRRVYLGSLSKEENEPSTTSVAYDEMWVDWELVEDLCLGREQMILKAQRWLPQEPREEDKAYAVRLDRSFLYGAFKDTVETISSKPFSREVELVRPELLREELQGIAQNVDRKGTDLSSFCKQALRLGVKYGHALALVDYPRAPAGLTLAQQRTEDIRPYWVLISPVDFIGWRTEMRDGAEVLTGVRIMEERLEPVGKYGDKRVRYIREITGPVGGKPGYVQMYKEGSESGKFAPEGGPIPHTYPGVPVDWLPICPKTKLFTSEVPLKELAELNLAHWQGSSDARNVLRFVAIAMLLLTGIDKEDDKETGGTDEIAWGPNQIIYGEQGASGHYIEHTGAGYNSLAQYLEKLEQRMRDIGDMPFVAREVDVTATAEVRADAKAQSAVQIWIRQLEKFVSRLYQISQRWVDPTGEPLNLDPKTGFSVDVFSEFGLRVSTRSDSPQIMQARGSGFITERTFLNEWKKRGVLGEELDVDEEIAELEREAKAAAPVELPPDEEVEHEEEEEEPSEDDPEGDGAADAESGADDSRGTEPE